MKHTKDIHFFGEMDLDIQQHPDTVYMKAFHISECCGYMVDLNKNKTGTIISLFGRDGEKFKLVYDNTTNKITKIIDGSNAPKTYTLDNLPKGWFGYLSYFYCT